MTYGGYLAWGHILRYGFEKARNSMVSIRRTRTWVDRLCTNDALIWRLKTPRSLATTRRPEGMKSLHISNYIFLPQEGQWLPMPASWRLQPCSVGGYRFSALGWAALDLLQDGCRLLLPQQHTCHHWFQLRTSRRTRDGACAYTRSWRPLSLTKIPRRKTSDIVFD